MSSRPAAAPQGSLAPCRSPAGRETRGCAAQTSRPDFPGSRPAAAALPKSAGPRPPAAARWVDNPGGRTDWQPRRRPLVILSLAVYDCPMPTISTFFGIVIQMFWREHAPPHFHAIYAEFEVEIDVRTLEVIRGSLPRRALAMVLEWAALHREELMEDWVLCQAKQLPKKIQPLE